MPLEDLHELRWSLFGAFLRLPSCEHCGGRGRHQCDAPLALTYDGKVVGREDHQDAVVSWPGCPRQWAHARQWGQDVIGLADCVRWEVARGTHLRRDLPAPSARLFREYLVLADLPQKIAEAKAARKSSKKQ